MKKKIAIVFVLMATMINAQESVNNYKYVIVPKKFDFVNKPDKYQTSSLTKFLFNKYGFNTLFNDETFPEDLAQNPCLALTADVKDNSGMFTTKSVIELKNCKNKVVYTSSEGKSKQKEYKKAYHEAIRGAFNSIKRLNYKYVPREILLTGKVKEYKNPKTKKTQEVIVDPKQGKLEILYAQPMVKGFQLVNTKPEVVFQALKTSNPEVFILKNKNGVLVKKGNSWVAEFYVDGKLTTKIYTIKF